jgi:hypothetical protein
MLVTLNAEKILNLTMQVIERMTFMLVVNAEGRSNEYSPINAQLLNINTKVQQVVHFTHRIMPQNRSILYEDDVGYFACCRR